jgi:hypothetical protein
LITAESGAALKMERRIEDWLSDRVLGIDIVGPLRPVDHDQPKLRLSEE